MNSDREPKPDDLAALREWKVQSQLPPGFSGQVWRRIAQQESQPSVSGWQSLMNSLNQAFARPALATGYLAVLLTVGAAGGYWHAQVQNARVSEQLGARYLHSMEPFSGTHESP
jgi:hypothetical protein